MTSERRPGSGPTDDAERWDAPVRYLRSYPEVDVGARGFPYYVCECCGTALQGLPRTSGDGVMLVCIWGCGQRFWIDDQR